MNPRKPQFEQLEPRLMMAVVSPVSHKLIAIIDDAETIKNVRGGNMGVIQLDFYAPNDPVVYTGFHARAVRDAALATKPADTYFAFLKVSDASGRIDVGATKRALDFIANYSGPHIFVGATLAQGPQVSLTKLPTWAYYEQELAEVRSAGVTVIGSAGNSFDGRLGVSYPAISPHVICAMADDGNKLWSFSNRLSTQIVVDKCLALSFKAGSTSRAAGAAAGYVARTWDAGDTVDDIRAELFAAGAWRRDAVTGIRYKRVVLPLA